VLVQVCVVEVLGGARAGVVDVLGSICILFWLV